MRCMPEEPSDSAAWSPDEQRTAVRERYAAIAETESGCCGDGEAAAQSERVGYDAADVADLDEANLGLGCGTPVDAADLDAGETVLDLGSGAGFDCFLAARAVGSDGRVVGVDMTPAMVETARENAAGVDSAAVAPVEFRLGEIEHLPVADASVDVVVSNCVVNLSPDKPQVFAEAFRALRPGGRLAISDVVRTADLPPEVGSDLDALTGFVDVSIEPTDDDSFMDEWAADLDPSQYATSATIRGRKPAE